MFSWSELIGLATYLTKFIVRQYKSILFHYYIAYVADKVWIFIFNNLAVSLSEPSV